MKLSLQLFVVVLNAQMNFCDNLLKFRLHTNTQGRRHKMASQSPCSLFHKIRTPTVNKHARIVEIG